MSRQDSEREERGILKRLDLNEKSIARLEDKVQRLENKVQIQQQQEISQGQNQPDITLLLNRISELEDKLYIHKQETGKKFQNLEEKAEQGIIKQQELVNIDKKVQEIEFKLEKCIQKVETILENAYQEISSQPRRVQHQTTRSDSIDIQPIRCSGNRFRLQEPIKALEDIEIEFNEVYMNLHEIKKNTQNLNQEVTTLKKSMSSSRSHEIIKSPYSEARAKIKHSSSPSKKGFVSQNHSKKILSRNQSPDSSNIQTNSRSPQKIKSQFDKLEYSPLSQTKVINSGEDKNQNRYNYLQQQDNSVKQKSNTKNEQENILEIRNSNIQYDEKKKKIDIEIERRIKEEQERRKKVVGASDVPRKINEKGEHFEDFRYTPLSTEKSRSKEVVSRLNLEKKLRDEKINKYAENVNKTRLSKSPSRNISKKE